MNPLSELLFGPASLPPATAGETTTVAAPSAGGAFAATLQDARGVLTAAAPAAAPAGRGAAHAAAASAGHDATLQPAVGRRGAAGASPDAGPLPPAAPLLTPEDPASRPLERTPVLTEAVPSAAPSGLPQPGASNGMEEPSATAAEQAATDVAGLAPPAPFRIEDGGPWALRLAVRATTREGIGQGSPSGNGLPPIGPDVGKALPDLPAARYPTPAPARAATLAVPGSAGAAPPVAAALETAAAGAVAAARAAEGISTTPVESVASVLQTRIQGQPHTTAGPSGTPAEGSATSAGSTAVHAAVAEAASLRRLAEAHATGTAVVNGNPSRSTLAAEAAQGERSAATPPATAGSSTAPSGSGTSHGQLHLSAGTGAAAPPNAPATAAAGVAQEAAIERPPASSPQAEVARQLGAVEKALDAAGNVHGELRRSAGADSVAANHQPLRQEGVALAANGALAAVLERRAIAEAAGYRRGTEQSAAVSLESVDRTAASGTEAAEQGNRPQSARPVIPVLQARDLSALAERIETLIHRRGGVANLNLSLSELGDVEIQVRLESKQAHVQFVVQDATARESLEAQLPRLRALLGEGGLELGDVGMGTRERGDGDGGSGQREDRAGEPGADIAEMPGARDSQPKRRSEDGRRLLDAFA